MPEGDRTRTGVAGVEPGPADEPRGGREERQGSYFRQHPRAKWGLLAAVVVIAAMGTLLWTHYSGRESTDDAQIDGHIVPISAKVGGTVLRVNVDDNQYVKAGEVLVQIDPRDFQVALDKAQADLATEQATARAAQTGIPITAANSASRLNTAKAGVLASVAGISASQKEVAAARAQLNSAEARLRETEARSRLAQQNLGRMKQLVSKDEISQQQYDASVADAQSAAASVDSARAAVAQAEQSVPVAESHVAQAQAALAQSEAAVQAAQTAPQEVASSRAQAGSAQAKAQQRSASVAEAQLNLLYTTIIAPVNGIVSRKSVEPGQVIQPGQPLMAVVPIEDIWVTANFKETQLRNMRVGQPVTVEVDTFGGRKFRGHIDSLAAATGSRFSLLPPENASGNYVKVVQRIPVKIVLEKGQDPQRLLRPGMSVTPTVITK